tara:strand:+ start:262 stop:453 length:192 start_codon:yes stop_codon:yes gene_type:complete
MSFTAAVGYSKIDGTAVNKFNLFFYIKRFVQSGTNQEHTQKLRTLLHSRTTPEKMVSSKSSKY